MTMKKFLLLALSLLLLEPALAQSQTLDPRFEYLNSGLLDGRTLVKANMTGLAFESYGFYAERMLSRRLSLQIGYSFRAESKLPFVSSWGKEIEQIADARAGYQMITPELRIYLGKGYGRGFYLSPYYRYESYNVSGIHFDFANTANAEIKNLAFSGTMKSHGFGIAIGAQWLIGKKKNIIIDWTIIGAHHATAKTTLSGTLDLSSSIRFSPEDQASLTQEVNDLLNDISIEGVSAVKDVKVTFDSDAQGAYRGNISGKHPFAWLRGNISIGYRF